MTEPPGPEPIDPVLEDNDEHDEVVLRLRALLREEPIEVDELARERRLRAALDAAPVVAPVPVPRRTVSVPWLTTAAVVVLVALGGYLLFAVAGSGGGQDESADSGAEVATADSAPATSSATDGSAAADATGSGAGGAAEEEQATTTVLSYESRSLAAGIVDLGEFADAAALRALVEAQLDQDLSSPRSPMFDATGKSVAISECVAERQASGADVVAIASIAGNPVVVIRSADGVELLAIPGCTTRPD